MVLATVWNSLLNDAVEKTHPRARVAIGLDFVTEYRERLNGPRLTYVAAQAGISAIDMPKDLQTGGVRDFILDILFSAASGHSMQRLTQDPKIFIGLNDLFEQAQEEDLGGQAGTVAQLLARLSSEMPVLLTDAPVRSLIRAFRQWGAAIPIGIEGIEEEKKVGKFPEVFRLEVRDTDLHEGECAVLAHNVTSVESVDALRCPAAWTFMFRKGLTFSVGDETHITKRAGYYTLYYHPKEYVPSLTTNASQTLPELGCVVDCGVMSGIAYYGDLFDSEQQTVDTQRREAGGSLNEEDERMAGTSLGKLLIQLDAFRSKRHDLPLHTEYILSPSQELKHALLAELSTRIESLGANEWELADAIAVLGIDWERDLGLRLDKQPLALIEGACLLLQNTGFSRIHVHCLGYQILLTKRRGEHLLKCRDSLLFASNVGASKAVLGTIRSLNPRERELFAGLQISTSFTGLKALHTVADCVFGVSGDDKGVVSSVGNKCSRLDVLGCLLDEISMTRNTFMHSGILEFEKASLVLVPSQIAPNPKQTSGIGDLVSSVAFVVENDH